MELFVGLMLPFIGTVAGSACVFFMKDALNPMLQKVLLGFSSGVMVAASIWSLIIPAMEMSEGLGKLSFMPAAIGFLAGIFFLLIMDKVIPHLHIGGTEQEGPKCHLKKSTMLVFAVTLHNIPEGISAGAVFAGLLTQNANVTLAGAFALSIGIAIQNFPEGAIISMPLRSAGESKKNAFFLGTLSGIVEPVAGFITVLLAAFIVPALPYLLAFAAGAMIYVVIEELIPEASIGAHSNIATIGFAVGFVLMMILDVALS